MAAAGKHKSERSTSENTSPVRCAYVHFHEKRTKTGRGQTMEKPRHDATVLFPKLHADPNQCANYLWLWKHINEAATKAWGGFPQGGHLPIRDGDAPPKATPPLPGQAPAAPKEYPWMKGHWLVEVTNYMDPGPQIAVMQGNQAVVIPARIVNGKTMYKSGDFFIVHLHAYTFHNEKFGVNFGFEGALWIREGEAIGTSGPRTAEQMFGSVAPVVGASVGPAPLPNPGHPLAPGGIAHPPSPVAPIAPAAPGGIAHPPSPVAPAAPPAPVAPPVPGAMPLPPLPGR